MDLPASSLDHQLSEEQRMLVDAARRYMEREYSFAERSRILGSEIACDPNKWADFARMGWLALPLPADAGGADGDALSLFLLAREFGRALVVEPYLPTVVLGASVLASARSDPGWRGQLEAVGAGRLRLALACAEPQGGYDWFDVQTLARVEEDGYVLNGRKAVVLGAVGADFVIVSARMQPVRSADRHEPRSGLSLFLVRTDTPGLSLRPYATIDGRQAAELCLTEVRLHRDQILGEPGDGARHLEQAWMRGMVWVLGEASGCAEGMLAATVHYLGQREQFGQKLAKFQALRHRVADMFVALQETRALCQHAAQSLAAHANEADAVLAAAKAWIGRTGRRIAEEGVQLHGAIAITDEYIAGHYLKRMIALDRMFEDGDSAIGRYIARRGSFDDTATLRA